MWGCQTPVCPLLSRLENIYIMKYVLLLVKIIFDELLFFIFLIYSHNISKAPQLDTTQLAFLMAVHCCLYSQQIFAATIVTQLSYSVLHAFIETTS